MIDKDVITARIETHDHVCDVATTRKDVFAAEQSTNGSVGLMFEDKSTTKEAVAPPSFSPPPPPPQQQLPPPPPPPPTPPNNDEVELQTDKLSTVDIIMEIATEEAARKEALRKERKRAIDRRYRERKKAKAAMEKINEAAHSTKQKLKSGDDEYHHRHHHHHSSSKHSHKDKNVDDDGASKECSLGKKCDDGTAHDEDDDDDDEDDDDGAEADSHEKRVKKLVRMCILRDKMAKLREVIRELQPNLDDVIVKLDLYLSNLASKCDAIKTDKK